MPDRSSSRGLSRRNWRFVRFICLNRIAWDVLISSSRKSCLYFRNRKDSLKCYKTPACGALAGTLITDQGVWPKMRAILIRSLLGLIPSAGTPRFTSRTSENFRNQHSCSKPYTWTCWILFQNFFGGSRICLIEELYTELYLMSRPAQTIPKLRSLRLRNRITLHTGLELSRWHVEKSLTS